MNDVFKQRNINATRRQVRHNEEPDFLLAEGHKPFLTGALIHRTINVHAGKAGLAEELIEVLNVVPGCRENDRLMLVVNVLVYNVHKGGFFLFSPDDEEVEFQLFGKL